MRCSSTTEEAPSNAPSSISEILLLLKFLKEWGGEGGRGHRTMVWHQKNQIFILVKLNTKSTSSFEALKENVYIS